MLSKSSYSFHRLINSKQTCCTSLLQVSTQRGIEALCFLAFCTARCHKLHVRCWIITQTHIFMPIPLLSAANLSAGKKGKGKHLVSFVTSEADRSKKRQGWRWGFVSLWPIKGNCSVLSTGDSLHRHRLFWQGLFICFFDRQRAPCSAWGHRLTCTASKSRQACGL